MPLKKSIHHLVQSFPSILHHASIRWLETDFPYMKLSSPAQSSSPSRLMNLCTAATQPFSVPQSALITLAVPPSCRTQSTKYWEITVGSLLVYPTSSHRMRLLPLPLSSYSTALKNLLKSLGLLLRPNLLAFKILFNCLRLKLMPWPWIQETTKSLYTPAQDENNFQLGHHIHRGILAMKECSLQVEHLHMLTS